MSTNDVPGANPANQDQLAMGAWAEHQDGSLIFVESTEANRVVYSIFDMSKDPPIEYRDAMPETTFKQTFTWKPTDPTSIRWTWHDKTPFDWNKVIKQGISDGPRLPSAGHVMTAAERIADSLRLRAREHSPRQADIEARQGSIEPHGQMGRILDKVERALRELGR